MNILIVDDEKEICNKLELWINYYFEKKSNINVNVISFTDVLHLYSYFEDGYGADIVFMDIKLNEHNGVEAARKLQMIDKGLACVFITGYPDYASNIFDANPIHFLLKPIKEEQIYKVIDKIIEYKRKNDDSFFCFRIDEIIHRIRKRDIRYVEAAGKNVICYTDDGIYKISGSFGNLLEISKDVLLQCHRSYMVNPERIKKIEKNQIELYTGEVVPLSRGKKKEVQDIICKCNSFP